MWKLPLEAKYIRKHEFDNEIIIKSSKIWKITKTRKTAQNLRIHRFFDLQNQFSLCWRSKSYKSLRGPASAFLICYVSRKGGNLFIIFIKCLVYDPSAMKFLSPLLCFYQQRMLFFNQMKISSTSLPGGNQVDGLPPASSRPEIPSPALWTDQNMTWRRNFE